MNVIFGTCSFGCTMCHARIKKTELSLNWEKTVATQTKAISRHIITWQQLRSKAAAAVGHHGVSHDKVYIYQLKIESGYSFVEAPFGKRGHLLRHGWCQWNSKSNSAYRNRNSKSKWFQRAVTPINIGDFNAWFTYLVELSAENKAFLDTTGKFHELSACVIHAGKNATTALAELKYSSREEVVSSIFLRPPLPTRSLYY